MLIATKRSDIWRIRLRLGLNAQGRRDEINMTIRGSRREAERVHTALKKEKDDHTLAPICRLTLDQWRAEWLNSMCELTRRPRTVHDYRMDLERYLTPELRSRKISTLRPVDIQRWVGDLSARGLSSRTVRKVFSALSACLKTAKMNGLIPQNPTTDVELPRGMGDRRRAARALTADEAARFAAAAEEDEKWGAMFVVMLTAGLRPGEAMALRWRDWDGGDCLRVCRAVSRAANVTIGATKTERERDVFLIPLATAALRTHRRRRAEQCLRQGTPLNEDGLMFPDAVGGIADDRNVRDRHFRPLLARAGLSPMRMYDLRHTAATRLYAATKDPKLVQTQLGHQSSKLTMDLYTHLDAEAQRRGAAQLAAISTRLLSGSGRGANLAAARVAELPTESNAKSAGR